MRRVIYILLLLPVIACSKQDFSSELVIDAEIKSLEAESKAITYGKSFSNGKTIGLFIYYSESVDPHTQFVPYGDKYRNIRATYQNGNWLFRFSDSRSDFDNIYLLNPSVEMFTEGLTVYAYSPWISGTQSITEIPFTLGGMSDDVNDLMRAEQNSTSSNARIKPDGNAKKVELTFSHAFAMLRLGLKCQHDITQMQVSSITLKKKDGGTTPLYVSGTYDAVNGTFSSLVEADELETVFTDKTTTFTNTGYTYVPVLILPGEYLADDDYSIVFQFDGQQLEYEYPIKVSDIAVGSDKQFKAGYTYTFNFVFDNHVRLDNVTIASDWTTINESLIF